MVEETIWRDTLNVPTQEWLRSHSEWYEEWKEADDDCKRDKIVTGVLAVALMFVIITILMVYGGY